MKQDDTSISGRNRRRRIRFSLSALLLGVSLTSAFLGHFVLRSRRQSEAVGQLTALGHDAKAFSRARVLELRDRMKGKRPGPSAPLVRTSFEWELNVPGYTSNPDATPPVPTWLRSLCGDHFFFTVRSVAIMGRSVSDMHVLPLRELPQLYTIGLSHTDIGDATLKLIGETQNPYMLSLKDTKITNAGIRHLASLDRLYYLDLSENPQLDDRAVAHLAPLTNLKAILIDDTSIRYAGVQKLRDIVGADGNISW